MKSREIILVLIILSITMNVNKFYCREDISVKKEILYIYNLDINGTILTSKIRVKIEVYGDLNGRNITIIDRVRGLNISSLEMLEGPNPNKNISNGDICELYWSIFAEKNYIVIEYRGDILSKPPLNINLHIYSRNMVFDKNYYLLRNLSERRVLKIDIFIENIREDRRNVENEDVILPYIMLFGLSYPEKYFSATDFTSQPNITARQQDNDIAYWNIFLQHSFNLSFKIYVKSIGIWKSIWIPPLSIDLIDDPWSILNNVEKNIKKLEKAVNETEYMLNQLISMRDELNNISTQTDILINATEKLGKAEIKYSKDIYALYFSLNTFYLNIRSLDINSTQRYLYNLSKTIDKTIDILNDLKKNYNLSEPATRVIDNIIGNLSYMKGIISNIDLNRIEKNIRKFEEPINSLKEFSYILRNLGEMHLKFAELLRNQTPSNLSEKIDELNSRIDELSKEREDLNKTLYKLYALRDIAIEKIKNYRSSISIFVDGRKIDEENISISPKIKIGIKIPLLVSELKIEGEESGEERAENQYNVLKSILIYIFLITFLIFIVNMVLRKFRRKKVKRIDAKDVEKLLDKISNIEKKL